MLAVLYLNNSWEWSGGYSQYLEWAGKGKAPVPSIDGWPAFMDYVKEFPNNKKAKSLFADYVKDIITRINRYTNISYVEDPTIMSWQIATNLVRSREKTKRLSLSGWLRLVVSSSRSTGIIWSQQVARANMAVRKTSPCSSESMPTSTLTI